MTCIVGYVGDDAVWIGGDSAGVSGYDVTTRADRKVFVRQGPKGCSAWAFGFTSSFRMGQLVRYRLELPDDQLVADRDLEGFMVTTFIDAVRTAFKAGGFASKDKEEESGGTFLVAHRGRLFCVEGDYQVAENIYPYSAVGAGESYAYGALNALSQAADVTPAQAIRYALGAAAEMSGAVCEPFHVVKVTA